MVKPKKSKSSVKKFPKFPSFHIPIWKPWKLLKVSIPLKCEKIELNKISRCKWPEINNKKTIYRKYRGNDSGLCCMTYGNLTVQS